MKSRRNRGATLGLVAACVLALIVMGFFIFFLVNIFGGGKQVANATDAGTVAAAKNLEAVTVDLSTLSFIGSNPVELSGLGIDETTGNPNPTTTLYNIYAYNRAVGAAILVCANAQSEGTGAAAANAKTVVQNLQVIGQALNTALQSSIQPGAAAPSVASAFDTAAAANNTNLMGRNSGSPVLLAMTPSWVGGVEGQQGGKANVYFNSALMKNSISTNFPGNLLMTSQGPSVSLASSLPGAQAGDSFVAGYTKFDYSASMPGVPPFYAAAVNPDQFPHLIDLDRFNNNVTPPDGLSAATTNVPFNAVKGKTENTYTTAQSGNLFTSAVACAVIGTSSNVYPITFNHGFVMLTNDHSFRFNSTTDEPSPNQPTQLMEWPVGQVNPNIFNAELWEDTSLGGGGAIDVYNTSNIDPSHTAWIPGATGPNTVFGVEAGPTYNPGMPTGYPSTYPNLLDQMSTWWNTYNTASPGTATGTTPGYLQSVGSDIYGHDITLDPTGGQLTLGQNNYATGNVFTASMSGGTPVIIAGSPGIHYIGATPTGVWIANGNARVAPSGPASSGENIVPATAMEMAGIQSATYQSCHDSIYTSNPPNLCTNTANPNLTNFENSFGDVINSPLNVTQDSNSSTSGLTSLEYMKGLVETGYINMAMTTGYVPSYTMTIPDPGVYDYPPVPSGSRIYNQTVGYAQPTGSSSYNSFVATFPQFASIAPSTIEFGANGTPYDLLNQIADGSLNSASAATATTCPGNIDLTPGSALWTNMGTLQGQLLQRVQEIDPTVTSSSLVPLLQQSGSQLDLGWSDVIYADPSTGHTVMNVYNPSNPATLTAFPAWLQTQLPAVTLAEPNSVYPITSGGALLDGTPSAPCTDNPWDINISGSSSSANIVDARITEDGNVKGDLDIHDQPFTQISSNMNTFDGATWIANSGKGGLLGQMVFQQRSGVYVDATGVHPSGSATFAGPN